MNSPKPRCLIANRGEIAVRIIRACRELDIETVAVYSEADANSLHVLMADLAFPIGASNATESYLNIEKLLAVADEASCDFVHPGYGFLSESAVFAQAVLDADLIWVGPPPQAIHAMGSKTEARALMQSAGVPVVPGFQSETATLDEYMVEAQKIGFPLMVKASAGGGGKGIRIVDTLDDLPNAIESAQTEARNAFGDETIFLERYIENARHIEIQVLADTHGNAVHLFERECSLQRRHQKIIEESPSAVLAPEMRDAMGKAGVDATKAVRYVNAGTVEFIVTPTGEYYFLEMNTRLQVEHPVTEMVTGLDLVQLQLRIANGEPLPFTQSDLTQQGHSIECRIYAEDPNTGFLPSIGTVACFVQPMGPGIRVDTGIQSGDEITIHYDPMIAKLVVYAPTRETAIQRMKLALQETIVLGTITNLAFLQSLLDDPAFATADFDTKYVDRELERLTQAKNDLFSDDLALIMTALGELHIHPQVSTLDHSSGGDLFSPWNRADSFRMGYHS